MTGVRIVSCRSADLNMFQMKYNYNRELRITQIPMKEGAALGVWMICTRFEVYVCSYVEWPSMKVDQFFLEDDNQRRDFSSGYCS